MQAWAVIGAGYGDEGKGRTVDALAAALGPGTVVVRTNGGAQAGHSVVAPGGERHVFHHIGSGALAGAATHLSRFAVSHPMLFAAERDQVAALGGNVAVTADPRGPVTTPWDMLVNQIAETGRGERRHGSCGLGFGETAGRCEETPFALTVGDLGRPDLRDRLLAIREAWLPARLAALDLRPDAEATATIASDAVLERFLADCAAFADMVQRRDDADLAHAPALVLEAAQGLLLDQRGPDFPFVTRSNTGLANMLALAAEAGIARLDVIYATRCYLSRHGRGPMSDERDIAPWFTVDDPTNRPNPWQETLRLGLLDPQRLTAAIATDAVGTDRVAITRHLAVTCLDQARGGIVEHLDAGHRVGAAADRFAPHLGERIGAASVFEGWGPARGALLGPLP